MDVPPEMKKFSVTIPMADFRRLEAISKSIGLTGATLSRILLCHGLKHTDEALAERAREAMAEADQIGK